MCSDIAFSPSAKDPVSRGISIFRFFHVVTWCYQRHGNDIIVKNQAVHWTGQFKPWLRPWCFAAWKVSVFGVILVHIFQHLDWMWTECIQSECGKMRTRITPNTDTFYAVFGNVRWETLIGKNWFIKLKPKLNQGGDYMGVFSLDWNFYDVEGLKSCSTINFSAQVESWKMILSEFANIHKKTCT